jgi:hypothetical protein
MASAISINISHLYQKRPVKVLVKVLPGFRYSQRGGYHQPREGAQSVSKAVYWSCTGVKSDILDLGQIHRTRWKGVASAQQGTIGAVEDNWGLVAYCVEVVLPDVADRCA